MPCHPCMLEDPTARELPVDVFLQRLAACDGCPLAEGPAAQPAVALLVAKHREAQRALRKLENDAAKWKNRYDEIVIDTGKYEERLAIFEGMAKTSAREVEDQLLVKIDLVERQRRAILDMSAPIIHVWSGILAVPVIGPVDSERAATLTENLLAEIQSSGARSVILDMTGAEALDDGTAGHVERLCQAVRLLGARILLTGLRGEVARAMVSTGIDLPGVMTLRNVREALRACGVRGGEAL